MNFGTRLEKTFGKSLLWILQYIISLQRYYLCTMKVFKVTYTYYESLSSNTRSGSFCWFWDSRKKPFRYLPCPRRSEYWNFLTDCICKWVQIRVRGTWRGVVRLLLVMVLQVRVGRVGVLRGPLVQLCIGGRRGGHGRRRPCWGQGGPATPVLIALRHGCSLLNIQFDLLV